MRYSVKWPVYAKQWNDMSINPSRVDEFNNLARKAIENKSRYQAIEAKTGVPWWLIAVLHRRESDANFNTYLGNGDLLSHPTHNVPRGRGPFPTFEAGAIDALHLDGLDAVKDWRLEKSLYYCEIFNGTGYDIRFCDGTPDGHLPSPYIWGGSSEQRPGKYVSDGKFSRTAWDTQPGCAPLIAMIAKLDPSVQFIRETTA